MSSRKEKRPDKEQGTVKEIGSFIQRHRRFIARLLAILGGGNFVLFSLLLNPEAPISTWTLAEAPKMAFTCLAMFGIFYCISLYFACVLLTSSPLDRIVAALLFFAISVLTSHNFYHPISMSVSLTTAAATVLFGFMRREKSRNFPTIDEIMKHTR